MNKNFISGVDFNGKPYIFVDKDTTDIVIIRGEKTYSFSIPVEEPATAGECCEKDCQPGIVALSSYGDRFVGNGPLTKTVLREGCTCPCHRSQAEKGEVCRVSGVGHELHCRCPECTRTLVNPLRSIPKEAEKGEPSAVGFSGEFRIKHPNEFFSSKELPVPEPVELQDFMTYSDLTRAVREIQHKLNKTFAYLRQKG